MLQSISCICVAVYLPGVQSLMVVHCSSASVLDLKLTGIHLQTVEQLQ